MKRLLLLSLLLITIASSAQTHFGIKSYNSEGDARGIGIDYIRNSLNVSTGYGLRWMQLGFHYVTNVVYKSQEPKKKEFPSADQLPAFTENLRDALFDAPFFPSVLVVENEENWGVKKGNLSEYRGEFLVTQKVGKEYNIPVTNGGTTMPTVNALIYHYLTQTGRKGEATAFKQRNQYNIAGGDALNWLLTEMELLPKDFDWNFHYQVKNGFVGDYLLAQEAIRWKRGVYGLMCNEGGCRDQYTGTVTAFINASKTLSYFLPYAMTGAAGNAKPWTPDMRSAMSYAIK